MATKDPLYTRKQVECPICLEIIRKSAVTKCGHRFCQECIEKSMRLGNHYCPTCRAHHPSRRSLKADEKFDNIIANLYPDIINQYEDEELELNETEQIRNEQVKATIPQTVKQQSEASSSKRVTTVETQREEETIVGRISLKGTRKDGGQESSEVRPLTSPIVRTKNPIKRRKRVELVSLSKLYDTPINVQATPLKTIEEVQICVSSENEETDSSSGDDWCPLRWKKRATGASASDNQIIIQDLQSRPNVQTPALSSKDKGKAPCFAEVNLPPKPCETKSVDDSDANGFKEIKVEFLRTNETALGLPESLEWGRSSMRSSNMRKKNARRNRIERLVNYLQNHKTTQDEMGYPNLAWFSGYGKG
ncbi:unnamed protein product [Microthlaspi erraticum]|uniref:RING-type domain-containing protein n=1 Tax=Microthlaspi erraticum TaxID=1685480 RepID=A0A6D2HRM5_9BRAS|nr:unnamed protein product [Microthlaspi erraticum]